MFGRGPFGSMFGNDPFFSDPFQQMDRMLASVFSDPFMGVGGVPRGQLYPPYPAQQTQQRAPVIEEVAEHDAANHQRANDQPIVEEPDDDGTVPDRAAQRQRRHSPQRPPSQSRSAAQPPAAMHGAFPDPFGLLGGSLLGGFGAMAGAPAEGSNFMYSSTSMGGPGVVAYSSSSTTRIGPGGVRETQSVVRDGFSGKESVTISRGVGERARTVTRVRDASGREQQQERLQGIQADQAEHFDDEWRQQAERALGGGRLGAGGSQAQQQQQRLALPSSGSGGRAAYADARPAPPAAAAQQQYQYPPQQQHQYQQPQQQYQYQQPQQQYQYQQPQQQYQYQQPQRQAPQQQYTQQQYQYQQPQPQAPRQQNAGAYTQAPPANLRGASAGVRPDAGSGASSSAGTGRRDLGHSSSMGAATGARTGGSAHQPVTGARYV